MGLAYLITSDKLQLLCERKVLKEAEYAALLDAGQLIAAARAEAERIVAAARAEAGGVRHEAHARGLREGQAAAAARCLDDAARTRQTLIGMREQMARLVVRAAQRLMGECDAAAWVDAALRHVEQELRHEPFVRMRVSPAQESAARAAVARWQQRDASGLQLSVQVDASLANEACVLHTAAGVLEVGIAAQLAALARALGVNHAVD